jgi:hypothetical protein
MVPQPIIPIFLMSSIRTVFLLSPEALNRFN